MVSSLLKAGIKANIKKRFTSLALSERKPTGRSQRACDAESVSMSWRYNVLQANTMYRSFESIQSNITTGYCCEDNLSQNYEVKSVYIWWIISHIRFALSWSYRVFSARRQYLQHDTEEYNSLALIKSSILSYWIHGIQLFTLFSFFKGPGNIVRMIILLPVKSTQGIRINLPTSSNNTTKHHPWASYRIRKIAGAHALGNAGNVFPATAGKRSRHASRHVRDARAVMHARIAN